jgi:membrane protease subunit (stomatin/prohibitin family)
MQIPSKNEKIRALDSPTFLLSSFQAFCYSSTAATIAMDILGFIKGELLEIIEFNDDSRDTLSWRFPDDDHAIKNGAQLIVRESQAAQFVYLGQYGDCFDPGKHTLVSENIPVLTTLKGWKYG